MASTAGSSIGLRPGSGRRQHAATRLLSRAVGVAAVAICGVVVFFAFAVTVLDLGPYGLPALALAVTALVLAVVSVRRGHAGAALAIAVVSAPLAFGAALGGASIGEGFACSGREREALSEIVHLGGVHPGIKGDLGSGGCIVRYTADADQEAVVRHYTRVLDQGGWQLGRLQQANAQLFASRHGLQAWISWWHRADSSMRIVVSVND